MPKSRKDSKRKNKSKHYSLMVSHAKHAEKKKRIELFKEMMAANMPQVQQENVVEDSQSMVDVQDIEVMPMDESPSEPETTEN